MVEIINPNRINNSKLPRPRNFFVLVKNIPNKSHKKTLPFVTVVYVDDNKAEHKIESFCLLPSDIGSVSGELIHRLMEQLPEGK